MRRVIKIGTSTLMDVQGQVDRDRLVSISRGVKQLMQDNQRVVLVVSGAVALGRTLPQSRHLSRSALASLGQTRLMAYYQDALLPYPSAEMLLGSDVEETGRATQLTSTLDDLTEAGIVPLINGNDATECHVGDNDVLAARVARVWGADQLVILSDVDGLYSDNPGTNPKARRIARLAWVTEHHLSQFGPGNPGPLGSGGIVSKLAAAALAQEFGIETILTSGRHPEVWDWLRTGRYHLATRFEARKEFCHADGTIS
ncbi:glutamate 5-kinase [Sulfobacillus harzensis]|uniref:Glutamate 5-kinase n=1 Tax=Sulfobacillus harzensis TaxID=2729629 RepID=A0A7Y0L491_9FIRM|nr:glutamate 5-kinase [Sulfobacillus harzensis]NMP22391.1 glutamate 5-kinase [Sulfobacillus harzensis]